MVNKKIKKNKKIVLHKSCILNNSNIIKCIIIELKKILKENEFKNFINSKTKKEGLTSLHYLSYNGNIKMIKFLIENGSEINILSNNNLNMIHMSAKGNQTNSLIYFKEKYNLNIEEKDINNSTPLHLACEKGNEEIIIFLLSLGCNINCQDKFGRTPLFICILFNQIKIIKKLIQRGADVNIKDYNEKLSSIEKSQKVSNDDIKKIFVEKNLCEKLFFNPDINVNKFNKVNVILFLVINFYICFTSLFAILSQGDNFFLNIIYFCFIIILFGLYFILFFSNPGKVENIEKNNFLKLIEIGENLNNYCPYCIIKKNFKIKHCLICNVCVYRFDHHCFWIDNCIGDKNYYLFYSFVFYMNIFILFNIFISIYGKNFFNYFLGFFKNVDVLNNIIFIPVIPFFKSRIIRKIITIINFLICLFFIVPLLYKYFFIYF